MEDRRFELWTIMCAFVAFAVCSLLGNPVVGVGVILLLWWWADLNQPGEQQADDEAYEAFVAAQASQEPADECACCDGPGFGRGEHDHSICEHVCCPDDNEDDR